MFNCDGRIDCEKKAEAWEQERKELIEAQDQARNNPDYQPNGRQTYCNQALCSTAQGVGINAGEIQNGKGEALLADQQRSNFANSEEWRAVSREEAQFLANRGEFVAVTGPGHVASVRPEGIPGEWMDKDKRGLPLLNNIGRQNGVMRENYAFTNSVRDQVRYYVRK